MNPLVSIIIPTFNRANRLKRALVSVFAQTFTDYEVLIMDDGSTDNTLEVVNSFNDDRIRYDWAENFGGPGAPRNRGLSLARGEYIAFLDSDDWWLPKKLEESIKYLNLGADIIYHDVYNVKNENQRFFFLRSRNRNLTSPVLYDLIKNGSAIPNSSVVTKKYLLDKINGISEDKDLIAWEDYDTWIRIAQISEKFQKIPKVLGYYWCGGGNISNLERNLKIYSLFEKHYEKTIQGLTSWGDFNWLNYARGRTYFLMGNYEKAKKYLKLNLRMKAPLGIIFKTYWMLFKISLYRFAEVFV